MSHKTHWLIDIAYRGLQNYPYGDEQCRNDYGDHDRTCYDRTSIWREIRSHCLEPLDPIYYTMIKFYDPFNLDDIVHKNYHKVLNNKNIRNEIVKNINDMRKSDTIDFKTLYGGMIPMDISHISTINISNTSIIVVYLVLGVTDSVIQFMQKIGEQQCPLNSAAIKHPFIMGLHVSLKTDTSIHIQFNFNGFSAFLNVLNSTNSTLFTNEFIPLKQVNIKADELYTLNIIDFIEQNKKYTWIPFEIKVNQQHIDEILHESSRVNGSIYPQFGSNTIDGITMNEYVHEISDYHETKKDPFNVESLNEALVYPHCSIWRNSFIETFYFRIRTDVNKHMFYWSIIIPSINKYHKNRVQAKIGINLLKSVLESNYIEIVGSLIYEKKKKIKSSYKIIKNDQLYLNNECWMVLISRKSSLNEIVQKMEEIINGLVQIVTNNE